MSRNALRYGRRFRECNVPEREVDCLLPREIDSMYQSMHDYLKECYFSAFSYELAAKIFDQYDRSDILIMSESTTRLSLDGRVIYRNETIECDGDCFHRSKVLDFFWSMNIPVDGDYCRPKTQWVKVGKYLQRIGELELLEHWEKKTPKKSYTWMISSLADDVLSMSAGRHWTSCMKPGGMYELGPIYSVLAGDAVIYFTEDGADEPCGRVLLRKCSDGYYPEPRLYGNGPNNHQDLIKNILEERGLLAKGYNPLAKGGYSDMFSAPLAGYNPETDRFE